uniref:THO1-MOS11 C-terminal domain-containing protein n=1 Tax=Romanomermis culicivorax TaxID=13658 RepID=A0A915I129_ROMCU
MSEKNDKRISDAEDHQAARQFKTNDEAVPSTNVTSAAMSVKLTEVEKLKKRAERFGLSSKKLPSTAHE